VYEWNELLKRRTVAVAPSDEQPGYFSGWLADFEVFSRFVPRLRGSEIISMAVRDLTSERAD